jgi:hypothetical protein
MHRGWGSPAPPITSVDLEQFSDRSALALKQKTCKTAYFYVIDLRSVFAVGKAASAAGDIGTIASA